MAQMFGVSEDTDTRSVSFLYSSWKNKQNMLLFWIYFITGLEILPECVC